MKNFLVNLLKGLCYLALFVAAQNIGSFFVSAVSVYRQIMQDPSLVESEASMFKLYQSMYDTVLANSSLIYAIGGAITLTVLVVFFRARGKRLARETWLMPVQPLSLWPVVLLGISLAVLIGYGIQFLPLPDEAFSDYETAVEAVSGGALWIEVLSSILIAPIVEEIVFRGLVFTRFCRALPAPAAVILAATCFGAMHGTILWAAYGFIGGIAMALVYMKYRSLYASILMHCVFNLFGGYVLAMFSFPSAVYDVALFGASLAGTAALGYAIWRMPRSRIDLPMRRRA